MRNNIFLIIIKFITFSVVLFTVSINGQSIATPRLPEVKPSVPSLYPSAMDSFLVPSSSQLPSNSNNYQQRQNEQIMNEVNQNEKLREQTMQSVQSDIEQFSPTINYDLPSWSKKPGTEYYRDVFDRMSNIDIDNYSVKDINFQIENAYFENQLNKEEFDRTIKQTVDFILAKMKERSLDKDSNTAKNFMLFEFFSQPMQVKGFKEKHFPIKYDFEDYWGGENWAKMFVTKLLKTNSGQCHSMPLLYLILAEAIDAQAYLALSPNHSYIKFQDEKGKWYNLEITNGMLTVPSFILNNGYITAEAMQHRIYMQDLTKQQLLSQFYTDLASGYLHKFGYDEFVENAINKALELYPNSINANMVKANHNTERLKYVVKKLGIDTTTQQGREKILNYPQAVEILEQMQMQYKVIDELGFQYMPADAYEKWLGSLKSEKNKQDSEREKEQLKRLSKALNNSNKKIDKNKT